MLSDDRAVVRRRGDGYGAWGTPWPGAGGFAVNEGLPLAGIGLIRRAPLPSAARLSLRDAVAQMAPVTTIPWFDREVLPRAFDGMAALCASVPCWSMGVPPDATAAEAVRAVAEGRAL